MGCFERFKRDKLALFLLIIILSLGIFIRLNDFLEVQYWNDDVATIPTSLLTYYNYPIYPGLSGPGEPILGHMIIGAGCLLSGEDFSMVSEVKPMFYPGRETLIGKQLINAFPYCHLPMYIFGVLFFLFISILAINLLPKYSALFTISFYAFHQELLQLSRWIHVDIFGYFFVSLGLLFLWFFYKSKDNNLEILYIILSSMFFGLSFAVKLPNAMFILFFSFIILDKYKLETLQFIKNIGNKLNLEIVKKIKYNDVDYSRLIKLWILSIIVYIISFLAPFYFKIGNFFDIINKYQSVNPENSGFSFNIQILKSIFNFLLTINILDTILFLLGLIMLVKFVRSKKEKKHKFIFYLLLLFMVVLISSRVTIYSRVFLIFSIPIIFITSLIFSKKYSIIKLDKKWIIFFIFIYISFSFTTSSSSSPIFINPNPIICDYSNSGCQVDRMGFVQKDIANYLDSVLMSNETFYWPRSDFLYYYIRPEESFKKYNFETQFLSQTGRLPTINDYINLFKFDGKIIRYIILDPYEREDDDESILILKRQYKPNKIIYSKSKESAWIYDLKELDKK